MYSTLRTADRPPWMRRGPRGQPLSSANGASPASAAAAEYGVARNTVRRDATFAEALDKLADRCGDEVRPKVLSRVAKWTHRDVDRLAKGQRPTRKSVSLPLGKPVEQVRVLRKVMGGKGLARLQRAIRRSPG
jgi:hypothetical protein